MSGGRLVVLATCCLSTLLLVQGIHLDCSDGFAYLRITLARAGAGVQGDCIGARLWHAHEVPAAQLACTPQATRSATKHSLCLRGGKDPHAKNAKGEQGLEKKGKGAESAVQAKPATTALSVLFYLATSLSLTLMNKGLFAHFHFPLFVTEFQLLVACVLLWALGRLGASVPLFAFAPQMRLEWGVCAGVLPVATLFVGMLALTNHCLRHVDLTFYQVLRSLVIPFNIICSFLLAGTLPSPNKAIWCGVVMVGFVLGSLSELNFSHSGLAFGVLSSVAVALYSVAVKAVLPLVGGDTLRLMHYTSALGALLLAPTLFFSGEWEGAVGSGQLADPLFWAAMTLAAAVGFLINLAYFALIKVGSPLSVHVAGCAKSALQTLLGLLIFRNKVTWLNAAGIALTLLGSALFSLEGHRERQAHQPPAALPLAPAAPSRPRRTPNTAPHPSRPHPS